MVTIDPHLHRRSRLEEIYTIPCGVLHAAPAIAAWIHAEVERPLLVGPDEESAQWVESIAADAGAPHVVLRKQRRGDRDVEISSTDLAPWADRTPVLADDIISTARTMIETVCQLRHSALPPPVCIGVHAIFAADSYAELASAGAGRIVSCDAIAHASNEIRMAPLLVRGIRSMLAEPGRSTGAGASGAGKGAST